MRSTFSVLVLIDLVTVSHQLPPNGAKTNIISQIQVNAIKNYAHSHKLATQLASTLSMYNLCRLFVSKKSHNLLPARYEYLAIVECFQYSTTTWQRILSSAQYQTLLLVLLPTPDIRTTRGPEASMNRTANHSSPSLLDQQRQKQRPTTCLPPRPLSPALPLVQWRPPISW